MTNQEKAKEIMSTAKKYGFTVTVRGSILTVSKKFTPGDLEGFRDCDMMYYSVFEKLPRTSAGSDWGTDGGSVGGMSALKTGFFQMNRSGGNKQILKALSKLL